MKRILLFIAVIILFIEKPANVISQQVCIGINDRLHPPQKIYEKLKNCKAILIGEMHGTNEAPQYTEGMVNLCLDEGRKVILGLEINGGEQSMIDSFLLTGDFSIIQRSQFFNQHIKYETSSVAMANLIKSCYRKPNVKIVCLDIANWKIKNRDSMMAVRENSVFRLNSGCMLITLTGNIHNKLDSNQFGKPMGYWLYKLPCFILKRKDIASFDVVFDTGTAWCCQPDCGIHQESENLAWIKDKCNYDNFFRQYENGDLFLYTKTITASLPLNP